MGIREALREVNEGSGLGFIRGREKGEFESLFGREVVLEDVAIVDSKFYENQSVLFTVKGDPRRYYRVTSDVVTEAMKKLQEGLQEDGLDWGALALTFGKERSKEGRRYYTVKARLLEEALNGNGSGGGQAAGEEVPF